MLVSTKRKCSSIFKILQILGQYSSTFKIIRLMVVCSIRYLYATINCMQGKITFLS